MRKNTFPKQHPFYKKNPNKPKSSLGFLVLKVGIEPTLPKELDFESSASTNSAT